MASKERLANRGRFLRFSTDYHINDLVKVKSDTWHERHVNILVRCGFVKVKIRAKESSYTWKDRYKTMVQHFNQVATVQSLDYDNNLVYLSCNNGIFPFHLCQIEHYNQNTNEDYENE